MTKKHRQKYNPLKSIYHLIHGLEQVPEGKMQKQANDKWQLMQKKLTRVLYRTATTLQHYDFVLLSKHMVIM